MTGLLSLLRDDWRRNYRYHGGPRAFVRCINGHRKLLMGQGLARPREAAGSRPREAAGSRPREAAGSRPREAAGLDCAVFSVVPEMSAIWAAMFERVVRSQVPRVLVGDCSGGLRGGTETCLVQPMLNIHHGEKLDLFFEHLCQSEVVVVMDDDIFWLDEQPLVWALDRLHQEPRIAVVALMPRPELSSVLRGKVEQRMGPVLVVRRDVWMRENLSFRIVYPPPSEGFDWFYDTGDFAQVELVNRGYRVEYGPESIQRSFVFFEGVSSWTLKLQKYSGDLRAAIQGIPIRQEKALQAIFVLRGLGDLLTALRVEPAHLVAPALLERARGICEELLSVNRVGEIRQGVERSIDRLRQKVMELDAEAALGESVRQMLGH